jgi:hypothetical protein
MLARVEALQQVWLSAANAPSDFKTTVASRWERRLAAAGVERTLAASGDAAASERWRYVIATHGEADAAATLARQFGAKLWGRFADDVVFELPASQATRFADQLVRDGVAVRTTIVAAPPKVVEPSAIFRRVLSLSGASHSLARDDAAWTFDPPHASRVGLPLARWTIALAVVAVAAILVRRRKRQAAFEQGARHAHLLLAAAGVAWWLWLWPAWVGWTLIAASVVSAWRLSWRLPKLAVRTRPSSFS